MNAEQFLQFADDKGFLDAKQLRRIRRQIQSRGKPVSAGRIAKVLVDKGLITKHQAKSLLSDLQASAKAKEAAKETAAPKEPEPEIATAPVEESSLELTPIDDDEKKPVAALPAPMDTSKPEPSAAPDVELEPLDAAPELELFEEPAANQPLAKAAELVELDDQATPIPPTTNAPPTRVVPPPVSHVPPGDTAAGAMLDKDNVTSEAATTMQSRRKRSLLAKLTDSLHRGPKKKQQSWDSPLMLVGGGSLLLMVIVGGGLFYFLTGETGEQVFAQAEEDYRAQSYLQSISKYERFLDRFPNHPKASVARVRQSLARIRQVVEGGSDWERALETTESELPKIKGEEAFGPEARPDLSRLLPDIYAGFVNQAKEAAEPERKQHFLDKSQQALALVTNPEYLPASLRKTVQLDIERVDEQATLIVREINRDKELSSAIEKIKAATAAQDTAAAYGIRNDLLSRYPGLASHPELAAAVQEITLAERENVTVSTDPLPATTSDHNRSAVRRVALAARRTKQSTGIQNRVIYVLASGALYGLDADGGQLLWRRWIGYASSVFPQPISLEPDADVLAFDDERQELIRLRARDGQLIWRLPLDDTITPPIVADNRIAIATRSGRLLWVDSESGQAAPVAQLPQALSVAPGVDDQHGRLYQVGEHSSLYILSTDTLSCDEVAYIGHRSASVNVPAISVSGHVFVAENGGDYSLLHILVADSNGLALRPALEPMRLDGEVVVPMQAFGRRLLVVTDRGAMHVFDVDPGNADEPVRTTARTLPTSRVKSITFPLVDSGRIFVADNKLSRFELQASRGELVRKWVDEGDEVYVAPLQLHQDVVFCARRHPRSTSTQVVAIRVASGRNEQGEGQELWTTELGAAPSMPAGYDAQRQSVTVVSQEAGLWDVGGSQLKLGKVDELAARAARSPSATPLTAAATLADGRVILAPQDGGRQFVLVDASGTEKLQDVPPLSISPQQSITRPVALGNEMLICSSAGTIHAIDPTTGQETLLPFQPGLSAGRQISWLSPAVVDVSQRTFVAADSAGTLYLIGPQPSPRPHLAALATSNLGTTDLETSTNLKTTANFKITLSGNLAVVGDAVLAVARGKSQDELRAISLPNLDTSAALPVEGRVTWGPYTLNKNVALVTTDAKQLHAVTAGPELVWSSPLEFGNLAGKPLIADESLVLTSVNGQVWRVEIKSGRPLPWNDTTHFDVGEPLGAGATRVAQRLLLLGRDSTLFLTELPPLSATTTNANP